MRNIITLLQEGDSVTGKNLLFIVFLGCMVLGITLMCFLSRRDDKAGSLPMHSSVASVLKSAVALLLDIRVLLVIPLLAYSGLQQAFVW